MSSIMAKVHVPGNLTESQMSTAVVFVHLQRICVILWNSDAIDDSSTISSRVCVRNDVAIRYNRFSGRFTVDTGYGMYECDSVGISDRWVLELKDTVVLPDYHPAMDMDTRHRCEMESQRLGLRHLSERQMGLMVRMRGNPVPESLMGSSL